MERGTSGRGNRGGGGPIASAPEGWVYVFNGTTDPPQPSLTFPSGVFSSREKAEAWIDRHRLSGTLTAYPLDEGAYDWGVANDRFTPKRDDQRTPEFIGRFAGGFYHWHYENRPDTS